MPAELLNIDKTLGRARPRGPANRFQRARARKVRPAQQSQHDDRVQPDRDSGRSQPAQHRQRLDQEWAVTSRIFKALDDKALGPPEIFEFGRELLHRLRGHAAVKFVGIGESFIKKRLRTEDGEVRQNAAGQHD